MDDARWGVIAIAEDYWGDFEEAQKQGEAQYRQLTEGRPPQVVHVYQHWSWDFEETVETLLQKGIERGQRGEIEEAEKRLLKALSIHPQNASAFNNLGNLHLLRQQSNVAIERYKQALQSDATDSAIFLNLGVAYYQKWAQLPSNEKQKNQRLKALYERAFEVAYRGVQNGRTLCKYLNLDPQDERNQKYCNLIYEAQKRVTKEQPQWRPISGHGQERKIPPVYWKGF